MATTPVVEKLEQQRAALTKKIKAAKEKQLRDSKRLDEKRHAIIGQLLMTEAGDNLQLKGIIDTLLKTKLTRKSERDLFGLTPMPSD